MLVMDTATHETAIRQRAYAIWDEEGRPDGREWDHWERALREIVENRPTGVIVGAHVRKPRRTAKSRAKAS
jgi:hypothetical protein